MEVVKSFAVGVELSLSEKDQDHLLAVFDKGYFECVHFL